MRLRTLARLAAAAAAVGLVVPVACSQDGTLGRAPAEESGEQADATVDAATPDGPVGSDSATCGVISNVVFTPNPNSVLSATVTFTTSVPATAQALLQNTTTGKTANVVQTPATTTYTTSQSLDLIGIRASSTFDIVLTARCPDGGTTLARATYETSALPPYLPEITIIDNDMVSSSPGWTLIPAWFWVGGPILAAPGATQSSIIMLDSELQIVWYFFIPSVDGVPISWAAKYPNPWPNMATKLANGDLGIIIGDSAWVEIDMMGNLVQEHSIAELGITSINNELSQAPNGNLLTLSAELKRIGGYPEGGIYNVVGSQITELGAEGGVAGRWSEFNMVVDGGLNPHDEGTVSMFDTPDYNYLFPDAGGTKDWTHDTATNFDVNDDTIVTTSRTLSYVYKFQPGPDGDLKFLWKMGEKGDFKLEGDVDAGASWMWNPYAAYAIPNSDHIMLFDDGTARPIGGQTCGFTGGDVEPCYSRAVEYALDVTTKTATVAWQDLGPTPFYSEALGSSYVLQNGDVLVNSGGEVCAGSCGSPDGGAYGEFSGIQALTADEKHVDIFEVTHATPAKTVTHFAIKMPIGANGAFPAAPTFSGFSAYRASRVPSIY